MLNDAKTETTDMKKGITFMRKKLGYGLFLCGPASGAGTPFGVACGYVVKKGEVAPHSRQSLPFSNNVAKTLR